MKSVSYRFFKPPKIWSKKIIFVHLTRFKISLNVGSEKSALQYLHNVKISCNLQNVKISFVSNIGRRFRIQYTKHTVILNSVTNVYRLLFFLVRSVFLVSKIDMCVKRYFRRPNLGCVVSKKTSVVYLRQVYSSFEKSQSPTVRQKYRNRF